MMKLIIGALLILVSSSSFAAKTNDPCPYHPILKRFICDGNTNPGDHLARFEKAQYNAATMGGGTTASIPLKVWLPKNAIITRSWLEVLTQQTTAGIVGPKTRINCSSSGDILASTNLVSQGAGFVEGVETGTAATFSSAMTADCQVKVDIISLQGQGLSTGKFSIYIYWVLGG